MFFLSWDLFFLPSILLSRMLCTSRSIDTASSCSLSPYVRQRRRIYHQRVLVERWTLSWQQNGKRKRISCPHPKGECVTLIAAIGTLSCTLSYRRYCGQASRLRINCIIRN